MMIRNIESIEPFIGNFTIRQIEWLSNFHFYITQDKYFENISILDITFLIKESSKTYELVIRFSNIESLKLESGGALTQISGFNIRDLKDHGYHPMKYLIEDYENGIINFYCNDIEFVSLKESENITI
ncbi:hypothetical protein SAMN04487896_3188 [Paenibacillus sp. ov031]|uniref:hypothetical protein n=1 Tax=unclassified Paenibacillus TaxID=185978 RepID=UPI00088C7170|nr:MULTISPECIES: hypothetical protein [unclassified Paenibacillus]SDL32094.1 hypothetical protein SAMN05428961_104639 [Paenibacillus sp. OK060]SHN73321.1 hypothetical protein SAMN04487896_3188 [Paenibacillus sp. ov031]